MEKFGRYEMEEELGRGAMGIVYRGIDPKINRTVALKCLHANLLEGDAGIGERFHQEMRALGRLVHPNIVTIFDAGEESASGQAYIVMEYVEGVSLAQVIKSKRNISIDQIVHIGVQICRGLDFAHSKGVVHRDIKPGNILLSEDLINVKIADFGIARLDDTTLTRTDCLTGTPQYMSPEQCRGEKLDGRSDLFALGLLLYELLANEKAFQGESFSSIMFKILSDTPDSPSSISPHVPEPVSAVVMQALEKKPEDRFASGNEMAEALLTGIKTPSTASLADDDDATRMIMPIDTRALDEPKVPEKQAKSSGSRNTVLILASLVIAAGLFFVLRELPQMTGPKIETGVKKFDDTDAKAEAAAKVKEAARVKAEVEAKEKEIARAKAEAKSREVAKAKAEAAVKTKKMARAKALAEADRLSIKKLSAGLLHFNTTPSGADILINGELMGISPASIELVGGKPYDLVLRKEGYHALEATIDVPVGETPMNLTLLEE